MYSKVFPFDFPNTPSFDRVALRYFFVCVVIKNYLPIPLPSMISFLTTLSLETKYT